MTKEQVKEINQAAQLIYEDKDKAQIVTDISNEVYKKIVFNIIKVLEEHINVSVEKQLTFTFKEFIKTMTDNAEMSKAVIRSGTNAIFGPLDDALGKAEENGILILENLLLKGQQQGILRKLDDNVSWMLITALIRFFNECY